MTTATGRRLIVCDDELAAWFLTWGARYGIKGYRDRVTWQATLSAIREILVALEKEDT